MGKPSRHIADYLRGLLVAVCALSFSAVWAGEPVRLSLQSFDIHRSALPFDKAWLYHAGDDTSWAQPQIDDSNWPLKSTWFRPASAEREGYGAVGWFRQHLLPDSSLAGHALFLSVASVGAIEVFLDGTRIYSLGTVSADPAREVAVCGQFSQPIRLDIAPEKEHVLAVRLSNHQLSRFASSGAVMGFQPKLLLGDAYGLACNPRQEVQTVGWSLAAGLCLVLFVLHLMIYFYYPVATENLTFAVFAGSLFVLSIHLVAMQTTQVVGLERLGFDAALLRAAVMAIAATGLHFVHQIATSWRWIRSRYIWLAIGAGVALSLVASTQVVHVVAILLMIELTRSLFIAVRARAEKIWIVAVGFGALILAVLTEALLVLGVLPYHPFMEVSPIIGLVIVSLSMSAYLGTKVAAVNKSLAEAVESGRKAVRALVESEARYRSVVENTVAGVGIVDDQNKVIFANDRWAEILAMPKEDLIGRNGFDPIVPEHLDAVREQVAMLVRGQARRVAYEFDINCADGKRRTVYCSASMYTTRDGHRNLVVHSTDITEAREAERKQREAIALAERTARMASIGVMAGGITHEINQPLNAIMLHAETLLYMSRSGKLDQKDAVDTALRHIVMSTERISEIIQHMRSFWISSPNAGDLGTVDLNEPVHHALQLMEQKIRAHAIAVDLQLSAEPLPVKADPLQLEQIVINLLTNAVNALDKVRDRAKAIQVRTYREGDDVGLEVIDNGPGLGALEPEKLFDPFFSTGKDKGGTGLGLAIVRMFVEKFKGTAGGRNNNGGGAAFSVRLPLATEIETSHAHTVG